MNKQYKADAALVFVTMTWGVSFILTKLLIEQIGVFNFLSQRFLLAALIAAVFFRKRFLRMTPATFTRGMLIGFILFLGYALQTVGLLYTSVSNSAFITGFSVVLVPLFGAIVFKTKPGISAALGAGMALFGLGLLTLGDAAGLTTVNLGDVLTLLAAVCFAFHILTVGLWAPRSDAILLAIVQIFAVGFFSGIVALTFESPAFPPTALDWASLLFLSIVCTSMAFIAQNEAQKYTTATHTALIYSGEPVFAAISEYLIYGTLLSEKGLLGAALILSGVLLSELKPFKKKKKDKSGKQRAGGRTQEAEGRKQEAEGRG